MSNPIVRRLMMNHKPLEFLDESKLYEANEDEEDTEGADEEYLALNDGDEEDDSHSTEISPSELGDDESEEPNPESEESGDGGDEEDQPPQVSATHSSPSHTSVPNSSTDGDIEGDGIEDSPENPPEKGKESDTYINPLDNPYAVKFTLGDEIVMAYANGSKSEMKGVVDGYDPEGFYRIKWADGLTTNGITDIALADLVKAPKRESVRCECGSRNFVLEDKKVVCDRCGRLREGANLLQLADKSRTKGKRMIRSEAHPVSTAVKPSIAESIKKAMMTRINESDNSPEFDKIRKLENEFWTRREELRADIEELGYNVDEMNDEYVVISLEDSENALLIPMGGTSRTLALDFRRAREI